MSKTYSLSIVIPVYNSSKTIAHLVKKLITTLNEGSIQIVLVNDGSSDNSHDLCLRMVSEYQSIVTYINLSRNFGEHNAVMAGLNYAKGEYVVVMEDDFQCPPDEVISVIEAVKDGDYDAVYASFGKKEYSWFRNIGSRLHNWLATYLLGKPKGLYLSSFKCINRFLVDQVTKYTGPYPYVDGLIFRCTRNIGSVKVRHGKRLEGTSGYTMKKLIRLWLNMFLNFSIIPLRISSLLGVTLSIIGVFIGIFVVIERIVRPEVPAGWPTIVVLITFFSGVQLMMMGLLGEYLGTLFLGQNQTPQFVVREVYEGKNHKGS